jgi:glyoxylase-like metal-dependent hydrolase (beta-lactamase superfamily II)
MLCTTIRGHAFTAQVPSMSYWSRRDFLDRAVSGLTLAAAGTPAAEARAAEGSNLTVVAGASCNVVALRSGADVLLVDGGTEQESAALLKRVLKESGGSRITTLINTHWHPEQTGSNERLGKGGARLIAHENTRLWLGRPINAKWLPHTFGPLPPKARPVKTTFTTDRLDFGDESVEYGYLPQAHTDGDLYVLFRNANVLMAGGAVSAAGWPRLDWETGGWIGGLVAGYDRLLKIADASTRIVPANGPELQRADLEKHRKMYFTLYERVVACLNKGLGPDETVATQPAQEFTAQWGNADTFVDSAFRSLWGHFANDA